MRKIIIGVLLLLFLTGCSSSKKVEYHDVSVAEAKEMIMEGDAAILDVRSNREFSNHHIEGAVNVDVETISFIEDVFPDKTRAILVYCQSGMRSKRASEMLIEMGYTNIYNLVGGLTAYEEGE